MTNDNKVNNFIFSPLIIVASAMGLGPVLEFESNLFWYDRQRIEQIVLLLIMVTAGLTIWRSAFLDVFNRSSQYLSAALFIGFLFGAASAIFSEYPRYAWLEWSTFFLLLVSMLLIAEQTRSSKNFDLLAMRVVWLVALLIALRIMMGYLAALIEQIELNTIILFSNSFSNRRFFGQVATMIIPLLAYPLLNTKTLLWQRGLYFLLLASWWMLVFVSGTRGSVLAITGAIFLLIVVSWESSRALFKWQFFGAVAGGILFVFFFLGLPAWLDQVSILENRIPKIAELSGRDELWRMAWLQIQAHPWLGIGPMHFATLKVRFGAHPHNALLQFASEWGAIATAAFILVIIISARRMLRFLRQSTIPDKPLLLCLAASLLGAGIQSMVDGVFVVPYTQVWLIFVAGWAIGICFRGQHKILQANPLGSRVGFVSLSFLAIFFLISGVYPEAFRRELITQAYFVKSMQEGRGLLPRYWVAGEIP